MTFVNYAYRRRDDVSSSRIRLVSQAAKNTAPSDNNAHRELFAERGNNNADQASSRNGFQDKPCSCGHHQDRPHENSSGRVIVLEGGRKRREFLGLFRRNQFDDAMDQEFQSHFEMLADFAASRASSLAMP